MIVSESLDAACGQFEQVILAQMLRTAGIGRAVDPTAQQDDADPDGDATPASDSGDAFSQLVAQSLAAALERAGGIGLRPALRKSLEDDPR